MRPKNGRIPSAPTENSLTKKGAWNAPEKNGQISSAPTEIRHQLWAKAHSTNSCELMSENSRFLRSVFSTLNAQLTTHNAERLIHAIGFG